MEGRHTRIHSPELGRDVHLWQYGWFGPPLVVFPTAAGMAHEWQSQGMIEVLAPLLRAGKLKLYCPESNVSEAWTKAGDPAWRIQRHLAYERFVMNRLVPYIHEDCRTELPLSTAGASLGAMYSANMALKFPETFRYALCMSGRYLATVFTNGFDSPDVYYNNPLAYMPNLSGEALEKVRQNTHLTLVCGLGKWEEGCKEETAALAHVLRQKGVSVVEDFWGRDVYHDWAWWRRQAAHHLGQRFGR